MGTIINVVGIIAGGIIGLFAGKLINERIQETVRVALGLSVITLSIAGIVAEMIKISQSGGVFTIKTAGTYIIIFSLVLGGVIGEIMDIDKQMDRFGTFLKVKSGNAKDGSFVDGFVTASLTVCIGAMAVVGAIMDGITGDYSILVTKTILDFVFIMAMTAGLGKGCIFSAIPVGIWQGSITLLAKIIEPIMNDLALSHLSLVGNILIACVGVNLILGNKGRIKVANLMPAIIFAVVAAYIPFLN